jgi:acyl dehydratase
MRRFEDVQALQAAVGEHLGFSRWRRMDQAVIDQFAEATGDRQWIHVDLLRAASGPYEQTIAHGWLTLSVGTTLLKEVFEVGNVRMSVNYGVNRVRFPSPVRSGTRIRTGAEVLSVAEIPGGCQAVFLVTVEVDDSEKPACVAETVARYYAA